MDIQVYLSVERFRSSRLEVLCKKTVLKLFEIFSGKHSRQSPIMTKLQAEG